MVFTPCDNVPFNMCVYGGKPKQSKPKQSKTDKQTKYQDILNPDKVPARDRSVGNIFPCSTNWTCTSALACRECSTVMVRSEKLRAEKLQRCEMQGHRAEVPWLAACSVFAPWHSQDSHPYSGTGARTLFVASSPELWWGTQGEREDDNPLLWVCFNPMAAWIKYFHSTNVLAIPIKKKIKN